MNLIESIETFGNSLAPQPDKPISSDDSRSESQYVVIFGLSNYIQGWFNRFGVLKARRTPVPKMSPDKLDNVSFRQRGPSATIQSNEGPVCPVYVVSGPRNGCLDPEVFPNYRWVPSRKKDFFGKPLSRRRWLRCPLRKLKRMRRAATVDYRVSRVPILCKDCR
jgi:hypothetical protein